MVDGLAIKDGVRLVVGGDGVRLVLIEWVEVNSWGGGV